MTGAGPILEGAVKEQGGASRIEAQEKIVAQ